MSKKLSKSTPLYQASGGTIHTKRAWLEWAAWIFNAGITPNAAKQRKEFTGMPKDLWNRIVDVLDLKKVRVDNLSETELQAYDTYKYFDIDNKKHGDI